MNLVQLNNLIHSSTKVELQSNLSAWKGAIKTVLLLNSAEDELYYKNHTGRELFSKLYNFGMTTELTAINDTYDAGFRPTTVTGIKT